MTLIVVLEKYANIITVSMSSNNAITTMDATREISATKGSVSAAVGAIRTVLLTVPVSIANVLILVLDKIRAELMLNASQFCIVLNAVVHLTTTEILMIIANLLFNNPYSSAPKTVTANLVKSAKIILVLLDAGTMIVVKMI